MIAGLVIAKKHSSRLPHKNILDFCGLPLVEWSIIQSTCSHRVDKTFVSTDSERIAAIAMKHGAQVVWRDYVEDSDATAHVPYKHAIKKIQETQSLEDIIFLLPTTPLRKPDDLDNIVKKSLYLRDKEKNTGAISVILAPQLETRLYRKQGDKAILLYSDKFNNALIEGFTGSMVHADQYLVAIAKQKCLNHDTEFDMKFNNDRIYNDQEKTHDKRAVGNLNYYECEIWQTLDIDNQETFNLSRIFMDFYLLKGRGPEIYFEYKETNNEKRAT